MPENGDLEIKWKGHVRWERVWHYAIIVLLGSGTVWTNHLFTNSPTKIEVNSRHAAVEEHLAKDDEALKDALARLDRCEQTQDTLLELVAQLRSDIDKLTPPARNKMRHIQPAGGSH